MTVVEDKLNCAQCTIYNSPQPLVLKNKRFVIKTKILWEEVSDILGKKYSDLENKVADLQHAISFFYEAHLDKTFNIFAIPSQNILSEL